MLASLALLALATGAPAVSAPITNITYDVSFTRETAARRSLEVGMRFDVSGQRRRAALAPHLDPGRLRGDQLRPLGVGSSAPWPAGQALRWDKVDYDTWRIRTGGARQVSVRSWCTPTRSTTPWPGAARTSRSSTAPTSSRTPEGRSLEFPATVRIRTESEWLVATGMHRRPDGSYGERSYHDLVDMPFFVGRFDLDSATVNGLTVRLATYPAGTLAGAARSAFWDQYRPLFAPPGPGVRRDPVRQLHHPHGVPEGFRRRLRPGAPEQPPRHLHPRGDRAGVGGLGHRPRCSTPST
ncbi:MAG: hypothetical protein IPG75_15080 [Gemmatimonadetes bacterium]|nr:hypothetical protein [Gemmatimonadota bacterium]